MLVKLKINIEWAESKTWKLLFSLMGEISKNSSSVKKKVNASSIAKFID